MIEAAKSSKIERRRVCRIDPSTLSRSGVRSADASRLPPDSANSRLVGLDLAELNGRIDQPASVGLNFGIK